MKRQRVPTQFEEQVYAIVRKIPKGQTRSYRWVAEQLGNPGFARAVGNALNRNPYAPPPLRLRSGRRPERANASRGTPVPCHRVVKTNGSLGGYAGGPAKKRRLLAAEKVSGTFR